MSGNGRATSVTTDAINQLRNDRGIV